MAWVVIALRRRWVYTPRYGEAWSYFLSLWGCECVEWQDLAAVIVGLG